MAGLGGAEPPEQQRIFENLQKISLENCKKCTILAAFSKKFQNYALNFCRLDEKHN